VAGTRDAEFVTSAAARIIAAISGPVVLAARPTARTGCVSLVAPQRRALVLGSRSKLR
jgi:hypothetical protein